MKLYALFIGINKYAVERHNLNGCIADMQAMHDFLQAHCKKNNIQFTPKILTDADATRKNVIAGFSHFDESKNGDICVLYYSGHGSQAPCPPEFNETDGLCETIVCHDSRLPGGKDILDKELGALIYAATSDKDLHFTAIMDCCHAGSNTRSVGSKPFTARMAEPASIITTARDMWGFKDNLYREIKDVETGKVQYATKANPYFHLAAAKSNQTAKELPLDGAKTRGAFTYTLLQILQNKGTDISYFNLIEQVKLTIENLVPDQTPLYDGVNGGKNVKKALFLQQNASKNITEYQVNYTKELGWKINAGSLDGLNKGGKVQLNDNTVAEVTSVSADFATLNLTTASRGLTTVIPATILDWGKPKTGIVFAADSDEAGKKVLLNAIKNAPSSFFEMTGNSNTAVYRILAKDGYYALLKSNNETPLFLRVKGGFNDTQANDFLDAVEKVCKSDFIKNLSNPATSIRDIDIDFTVKKIDATCFKKGDDITPFIDADDASYWNLNNDKSLLIKDLTTPIVLKYDKHNDKDIAPAAFIRVKNNSNKPLFVGSVFCFSNYDLTNNYINDNSALNGVVCIQPGKFIDLCDAGFAGLSLILARENEGFKYYYPKRINEINVTAQFIISTENFDISDFAQDGLLLEELEVLENRNGAGRNAQQKVEVKQPDWRTKTLNFIVQRPSENAPFAPDAPAKIKGMTVKGNGKIVAQAGLAGSAQSTRDIGATAMPNLASRGLQPFNLEEGVGNMQALNVLELTNIEDVKQLKKVNKDNPFVIELDEEIAANETIIPLGCFEVIDEKTGEKRKWYAPIGTLAADGKTLNITQLPEPTPTGTRSISGSCKIFFQKVVMGKKTHPILQQVIVKRTVDLTEADLDIIGRQSQSLNDEFITVPLATEAAQIKANIAKAKRIVLYVHGIIGDTEVMAQSLKKAKTWQKRNGVDTEVFIDEYYDVALTFDYENLGTSIAENANSLRAKLKEVGLGNNHGKELHIIAHSMGGLVSRWMIEKNCTQNVVQFLLQLGTPNAGSEIGNVTDYCKKNLPKVLNAGGAFLGLPTPLTMAIAWAAGKAADSALVTMNELTPSSSILKYLNDGCDPEIPYAIIAGSTIEMQEEKTLWQRLTSPYDLLTVLLYHEDNDLAVRISSIYGIKGLEKRSIPTPQCTVKCDHITYFTNALSLDAMGKIIAEKCES